VKLSRPPKAEAAKRADPLQIVVGLRNPGSEYAGTRHNLGFEVLAHVAARESVELGRGPRRISAQTGSYDGALLVAPMTFMNDSGRVVRSILDYFKVPPRDLILLHDDIDLDFGRLRVQVGGGSGGHNGVRSVERAFGGQEFSRLKIGVGRPPTSLDPAEYVLKTFSKAETVEVVSIIEDAADVVELWLVDRARAQELAAHRGRNE
jgi:PTH1 family peptidyl-tRNA hydrolase